MIAECGPRQKRDYTHRNCVPKERFDRLSQQLQDVSRSTSTRRLEANEFVPSPSLPTPTNLTKRLRCTDDSEALVRTLQSRLRKAESNTRKVARCEALAGESAAKVDDLKDRVKRLADELWKTRGERDAARSQVRDVERVTLLLNAAHEREQTLKDQLKDVKKLCDAQVKQLQAHTSSLEDAVKEKEREVQEHCVRDVESSARFAALTQSAREQSNRLLDKVRALQRERDITLEGKRHAELRVAASERELKRVQSLLDDAAQREHSMKERMKTRERAHQDHIADMQRVGSTMMDVLRNEITLTERLMHGGRGVGEGLLRKVQKAASLQSSLGLEFRQLPRQTSKELDKRNHYRTVGFITKVLQHREPEAIAAALRRCKLLERMFHTRQAQPHIKKLVAAAASVIQKHWSARHALMLQFEVHCSRSEYDALRHLLSFRYNHANDCYERFVIWRNPTNAADTVLAPTLAARPSYEKERNVLFEQCGACASDDGLFCGLDTMEKSIVGMVEHYWDALDVEVTRGNKELLLVFTGDATGGWRGEAITHGEISIGSWAKGSGISRLASLPLFIMEGDDSAENLRSRAQPVMRQYNALKSKGMLTVTIGGKPVQLKLKMVCAADFQFFKAMMNMSKYTSAVWCLCPTDNLFKRPSSVAKTWSDVLAFYDSIGCELKDLKTMCELNHYSFEVLMGRKFKEFSCRCGYKSGAETTWRAAVEEHSRLVENDLADVDRAHSSMEAHCRHKPFNPPLLHQDTIDNSADVLHLIYINMFATFFELTILVHIFELEPRHREPFEAYLRSISVPIKAVKALSVTDMKQSLTGRDAKTLLSNAGEHIPALLQFAHTSPEEIEEAVNEAHQEQADASNTRRACANDDEDYDWESEGDDEEMHESEEQAEHEDQLTRMQRDAHSWDALLTLVYAMRAFERDDNEYCEARAVETFNAAAAVMREYKRLHPNAISACPHVALCVLPRQQVSATPKELTCAHCSHTCTTPSFHR